MIIQMIQPKNSPRGRVGHVIDYIFDVDECGRANGKKRRDEVRFVGASASLCCADPFHPLSDKAKSELKHRIDLTDIKRAFEGIELKNQRVKETSKHIVFSLREGESLTPSQWYEMIKFYLEGMGYKNNLWVAVTHHNTKSQHAHVLLSCIENTAPYRKTKDSHNFAKSAKLRDELEKMFGLEADHNPFVSEYAGKRISNSHFKTKKQCIRDCIDNSIASNDSTVSLSTLIENLVFKGVGCHVKLEQEQPTGISFSIGNECFSGGALGFGYSWPGLQRKGISYQSNDDLKSVIYNNKREESLNRLINLSCPANSFVDNNEINKNYYLIVSNDEFKLCPESPHLHRFSVFRLFTSVEYLVNNVQSNVKHSLSALLQFRKNLGAIYDFIYFRGRSAVRTFNQSLLSYGSTVEFLYEVSTKNSLFEGVISKKKNIHCLSETGFLLMAEKCLTNGSMEYELNTAATRQNPTAINQAELLNNPSGVTVLGDYHDLLKPATDGTEPDPVLSKNNHGELDESYENRVKLKSDKAVIKKFSRDSDDGFSF